MSPFSGLAFFAELMKSGKEVTSLRMGCPLAYPSRIVRTPASGSSTLILMVSFLDSEHPRMENAVEVISKQMQK